MGGVGGAIFRPFPGARGALERDVAGAAADCGECDAAKDPAGGGGGHAAAGRWRGLGLRLPRRSVGRVAGRAAGRWRRRGDCGRCGGWSGVLPGRLWAGPARAAGRRTRRSGLAKAGSAGRVRQAGSAGQGRFCEAGAVWCACRRVAAWSPYRRLVAARSRRHKASAAVITARLPPRACRGALAAARSSLSRGAQPGRGRISCPGRACRAG